MSHYSTLVRQAQSGTETERRLAFDELLPLFQKMAFSLAYHVLQDMHLAEDVVQESFITAYLRIEQLREPEAFPAWLKRIVLTQSDRQIRGKNPRIETLETRYDLAIDHPGPEALIEAYEMQNQVKIAIDALPEHERAVTEGFYIQGESQKELAERLQVPITTVKKRLQYARQHLRLIVGDLNAVVDEAIARVLKPNQAQPQPQPVYIYAQSEESDFDDDPYA
jgi:RNA polymerase sigma factor (sigma-70 family)